MSTQNTSWHADEQLLAAYVDRRLDAVLSASVEQHLDSCASCRSSIRPLTDLPAVDLAWDGIRTSIESPRHPWLVRQAQRLGLPEPTAVLLAATVALRTAWLASAFVTLGFAAVTSQFAQSGTLWPYLLLAPLIPVLGVAASYGPADDPFEALAVTTAYGRTRLILIRTLAVVAVTVPVCCLMGLFLPGPAWVAAAWLGPAAAMIPLLLALSSFIGPRLAAGLIAIGWIGAVIVPLRAFPATWPVESGPQLAYLAIGLMSGALLFLRPRRTRQIGALL